MISFHEPTIEDYAWVKPILYEAAQPGADYTFHGQMFWQYYYGQVGKVGGFYTACKELADCRLYLFPVGKGSLQEALAEILQDAKEHGTKPAFRGLTDETRAILEQLYPGKYAYISYRDSFDYIYTVEELTELHGKKLQSKRNHCNRFEQDRPDWCTKPLTAENLPAVQSFAESWYAQHEQSDMIEVEHGALQMAFRYYEALAMDGLVLYDGDTILGFSIGCRMNESYYDVCFEKALADVPGAYAMINREFSRYIAALYPAIRFLNREDDMGEEGLRKAKESYQPEVLLTKYIAREA